MVITETQLRVPCKLYKVSVHCISTRRLTTIEWLILSCTAKADMSKELQQTLVRDVFEDIFQIQSSEILIKPCIKNLQELKVIKLESVGDMEYSSLHFCEIELTSLGRRMLQDGLLPGEPRVIGLDIYYNPLTGKINSYEGQQSLEKELIDFGTESDYASNFPQALIAEQLQLGKVGGGRFMASQYRIEAIEDLASMDRDGYVTITVELDDNNLTTTPAIVEDEMKKHLQEILVSREITAKVTESLPPITQAQVGAIIGSGQRIKKAFLDICGNGKVLFVESSIYNLYKRNTSYFKNKTLLIYGAEEFRVEDDKEMILIFLPVEFPIAGVAVINEKGEHLALARGEYTYEEAKIHVPMAYEDTRLRTRNKVVLQWFTKVIREYCEQDVRFVALYSLPFITQDAAPVLEALQLHFIDSDIEVILSELTQIAAMCRKLHTEMFKMDEVLEIVIEKLNFTDRDHAFKQIKSMIELLQMQSGSDAYKSFVENVIHRIERPKQYVELLQLIQSFGITNHDTALEFDDSIDPLYDENIISDILTNIVTGHFTPMPELFEMDSFFNEYVNAINKINLLLTGIDLFTSNEEETLQEAIRYCPDIASLQSYVASMVSMNGRLIELNINVFSVMAQTNSSLAKALFDNINIIGRLTDTAVHGAIVEKVKETKEPAVKKKNKVFVIDTCALLNCPDIFLYFSEEEYIRIPTKVIDELGTIKDKRSRKYPAEVSEIARRVSREMESIYITLMNQNNSVRFTFENSHMDLLPNDFDPNVYDNQILSVALRYMDSEVCLISDDIQFRLSASTQNVRAISSESFKESHKEFYCSLTERKRQCSATMQKENIRDVKEKEVTAPIQHIKDEVEYVELAIDDMLLTSIVK